MVRAVSTPEANPLRQPGLFTAGKPIGGPASLFNIGGAPIAVLGGVFDNGLPIAGPVSEVFRGGSAPVPPTLFADIRNLSPASPIGTVFIGSGGAPIGEETIGGGGLPISPPQTLLGPAAIGFGDGG